MRNPLTDVIPEAARKYVYAVVFVALFVLSAWQAAEGDWFKFVLSVLGWLAALLAVSNVNGPATPPEHRG